MEYFRLQKYCNISKYSKTLLILKRICIGSVIYFPNHLFKFSIASLGALFSKFRVHLGIHLGEDFTLAHIQIHINMCTVIHTATVDRL